MSSKSHRKRIVRIAAFGLGFVALWMFVRGAGPRHSLRAYRAGPAAPHAAGRDEAVPPEPSCLSSETYQVDPQPVITPAALPPAYGPAIRVSCPDVFDAPDGTRRMWFRFAREEGDGGIGGASLVGASWVVDPQPAVTAAEFEAAGLSSPGCSWTEVIDGVARIWFPANTGGDLRAIFAATSPDGRRWKLAGDVPALIHVGRQTMEGLRSASVTRTEDGLRMYFGCSNPRRSTLCVATSTDGTFWNLLGNPVAQPPRLRRDEVVGAPQVAADAGSWHLWFEYRWFPGGERSGMGPFGTGEERSAIAHVSGEQPDGFDLSRASALVAPGAVPWASKVVDSPRVVREGERIVLYFRGSAGLRAAGSAIGRAFAVCGRAPPAIALSEVPDLASPDPEARAARGAWIRSIRAAAARREGAPGTGRDRPR